LPELKSKPVVPRMRLTVVGDEGDGECFDFAAAPGAIRIGRAIENDIVLSDERVSRLHACIAIGLQRCEVEDLRSRTGVALNGEMIDAPRPLRSGDLLRFGGSLLRFETDQPTVESPAALPLPPLAILVVLAQADREPRSFPLAAGEYSVGRDPSCGIVLQGEAVSRYHARLLVSAEGCKAADLGSRSGTLLNGAPLMTMQHLRSGDILRIGPYALQLMPVTAPGSSGSNGAGRRLEFEQTTIALSAQLRSRDSDFYLVCLSGSARGMRYPLDGNESLVGSSAACQPRLTGAPEHALTMRRDGDGFLLAPGGQAAGVRVSGGHKLPCRITAGSLLDVNGSVYRLIRAGDVFAARFDPAEFEPDVRSRQHRLVYLILALGAVALAAGAAFFQHVW
jgi:pSer/pThr/pTyr-binding forkhead associated (FHA) protein